MRIICDGLDAYAQYSISIKLGNKHQLLVLGYFGRSKTKIKAIKQCLGRDDSMVSISSMGHHTYLTNTSDRWYGCFLPVNMGRDHFTYCTAVSAVIGKRILLTSKQSEDEDWYQFLMKNYKMPILREWIPAIRKDAVSRYEDGVRKPLVETLMDSGFQQPTIPIRGTDISVNDVICYDFEKFKEEVLEEIISRLMRKGIIRFTDKEMEPLDFEGMDGYFSKYGNLAVENLTKKLNPLVELKSNVEHLALKQKSLFPQQAASVEGVCALYREGAPFAVLNHGMGCGKTIEAASAAEAIAVEKWLKKHPGKTLKDAYEKDGLINYRTIIMAPGHLVSKWSSEIREEIPYAKTTILTSLKQLVELRSQGRKPQNGKEFFIVSMDKAKLGSQSSPIPTKIVHRKIALSMCVDCAEENGTIVYKKGVGDKAFCPSCRGNNFRPAVQGEFGKFRGLACPHCGELLLTYKNIDKTSDKFIAETANYVLTPKDFASETQANSTCYHCGGNLWGISAKPLLTGDAKEPKESKWYKISHYTNYTEKTTKTAWVLREHEQEYVETQTNAQNYLPLSRIYGPRRYALSQYIKKYLKGFFDFCILDECHKYLGDSAQGVSAHHMIKASKFSMALTGTISNGTAGCFYNLFFMLEPKTLLNMGYTYSSGEKDRFCKEYGCVETTYEVSKYFDISNVTKNSLSRGKISIPARVKPGISPVLFGKLLMNRCLFMDISDLSKYLPKLHEEVRIVEPPSDTALSYRRMIDTLSQEAQSGAGKSILAEQLHMGLNYLDKPYGRGPIRDPNVKDGIICKPDNYEQYQDASVLLPKEKALVEMINGELSEGRNCFVYCTATNKPEANITERLKMVIERNCSLTGRVEIIRSESPAAAKREEYFHKRAAEGIKVFITNPKNVETGLDFCFKYEGVHYNYPTLIFYQISYELATIWQASRRAYRLSQKEECRTVYLAYDNSLQVAALQIMAKKQVATATIQGHFSAEGLSSMAQGVDARTLLAEKLAKNDMGDAGDLSSMFDVLNSATNNSEDEFVDFVPSKTFYELIGKSADSELDMSMSSMFDFGTLFGSTNVGTTNSEVIDTTAVEVNTGEKDLEKAFDSLFDAMFDALFASITSVSSESATVSTELPIKNEIPAFEPTRKPKKQREMEGQLMLFAC